MVKIALYARVSLDEGKDERRYQEPENQLEPLREWAKGQGWEVVGEYVDRGSGADPARPEFRRLLHDAMLLRFKVILVWRMDRFSREGMSVQLARLQELKRRGVGVRSLTESWMDTSQENPISEVILAIMAWVAAEERRKISERTKAGIQRLKKAGKWRGGRPNKGGAVFGGVLGSGGVS